MEEHGHVVMSIEVCGRKTRKQVLQGDGETLWDDVNALDDRGPVLEQEIVCGYEDGVQGQQYLLQTG